MADTDTQRTIGSLEAKVDAHQTLLQEMATDIKSIKAELTEMKVEKSKLIGGIIVIGAIFSFFGSAIATFVKHWLTGP